METQEVLHFMRGTLDKKRSGSTPTKRVLSLASFFMTSSFSDHDPLVHLSQFIPQADKLSDWYALHVKEISNLRREDSHDKNTVRHDLDKDSRENFSGSSWMHNATEATKLMPFSTEVIDASLIVKLLYKEAAYAYEHVEIIPTQDKYPVLTDIA